MNLSLNWQNFNIRFSQNEDFPPPFFLNLNFVAQCLHTSKKQGYRDKVKPLESMSVR